MNVEWYYTGAYTTPDGLSGNSTNGAVAAESVKTFRCPSSIGPPTETYSGVFAGTYGVSDYAACSSIGMYQPFWNVLVSLGLAPDYWPDCQSLLRPIHVQQGRLWDHGLLGNEDIADGASSTLMAIVEVAGRPEYHERDKAPYPKDSSPGAAWADAHSYIYIQGPLTGSRIINCDNYKDIYSFHPKGAVFPFADGSVHFLAEDIAPQTFYALFTPAQREVINPDEY